MAVTAYAHKSLVRYCEKSKAKGPDNETIVGAVVLTLRQQAALSSALSMYWGRQYNCPKELDFKPRHGYESRCQRDGFSCERYVEWIVIGCSDTAEVDTDHQGRPRLIVRGVNYEESGAVFDVVVPVNSDTHGRVHLAGVVPKGLPPRNEQKKTAPSAIP